MIYLLFIFLTIATIKFLPFLNLELSLAMQDWIKKIERNLENAIDALERKKRDKDNEIK
jgi:uncharacterized membrane protein